MKRFFVLCAFIFPLAAWAGLDEGTQAYATGDYAKAMEEFKALADQGNSEGQYFVGFLYHNGFGVKPDQAEALKWFQKAAQQGDVRAQYYAGIMFASGKGAPKDLQKAVMWLKLSAENPKSGYRDSFYTREEIKKIEKKMTPEQIAQANELVKNWKPQN
ncbi:MAG: tetratricopeptide repeat protein [Betaproteobacteria bacterium]